MKEHLDETIQVLLRVREANPTYPPPLDPDSGVAPFTEWLLKDETICKWVAVADGKVVGHVALSNAHEYILSFLASTEHKNLQADNLCEVTKLFVDPLAQGTGVARRLLLHALSSAVALSRIPTFAVVAGSEAAKKALDESPYEEAGAFNGIHGINYVFLRSPDDQSQFSKPKVYFPSSS